MSDHYLTLETLQAIESDPDYYLYDPWPWPPYGVSERDEREQEWWVRCPICDVPAVDGYCRVCGRGVGR